MDDAGMDLNHAQRRRALPRRLGMATLYLFLAYWIVKALGILLTIAFAATFRPFPSQAVPMLQVPAYVMSVPFHPLLNLLVWPVFGWLYLRRLTPNFERPREALRLGFFWFLATAVIDLFGWVLLPHPWHMTFDQFYIGYQPWISLIYLVIFTSPILAAQSGRVGRLLHEFTHRVSDLTDHSPDSRRAGPTRIAGAIAAVGFLVVAGYQVLLALGIAFSGAAWGGATLTPTLRLASAVSAFVLVLAALIIFGRAGYWGPRVPAAIFRWGTWVLVVGMALSALANFASPTAGERFFLGPSALLLAVLCFAATRLALRPVRR
jgi:hypothetical protein